MKINIIKKTIFHSSFVLFAVMVTLIILDYFNPLMGFLRRPISYAFITMFVLSVATNIVIYILKQFKAKNINSWKLYKKLLL